MKAREEILAIIKNGEEVVDRLNRRIPSFEPSVVRDVVFSILTDRNREEYWSKAVTVLRHYLLRFPELLPLPYTLALLYACLDVHPGLDGQTIWEIVCKLKGIHSSFEFDPYLDDAFLEEMEKIRYHLRGGLV